MALAIPNLSTRALFRSKLNMLFPSFNPQTDNYTTVLTDAFKTLDFNKATAVSVTLPPNSSVAYEIGTKMWFRRTGVGVLTFVAGAGVTITGSSGVLTDAGLNVKMCATLIATDTWDLQNGAPGVWQAWTPAFAGFSVDPIVTARYKVDGKTCYWWIVATTHGTSNNTAAGSKTMTMPFTSSSAGTQQTLGLRITNTVALTASGLFAILASSNVATIYKDGLATTTWTAGNCSWSGQGFFEIA